MNEIDERPGMTIGLGTLGCAVGVGLVLWWVGYLAVRWVLT